ncbi:MAG: AI-2E family transporter [Lachnospiraceae bacterium]|nr:AI-2E family transporter [Lachnospiraceae bacterium]
MEIAAERAWKKILLLAGAAVAIYLIFRFLLPIVLPFVFSSIVSVLYYPVLRKLYHKFFPDMQEEQERFCTGKTGFKEERSKKWFLILSVGLFYVAVLFLAVWLLGYFCRQGKSIVLNIPFYQAKCMAFVRDCCCQMDAVFHIKDGASYTYIMTLVGDNWSDSVNVILPKVTGYSMQFIEQVFSLLFGIVVTIIATFFMIQEYDGIREFLLSSEIGRNVCRMVHKCKETLKVYVKAQGFIMLMDGVVCTLAFWLIEQPYFLILGFVVAVVDALPVFGAGLILFPYTIFLILGKKYVAGVVLLLAYIACVLIRQVTEPRMIGNEVGIKPLYTIASMYIGFKLFGVYGFLLGPVGLLIMKEVYGNVWRKDEI